MRHGYHMGMGFYGHYVLIIFLIIFSILIYLLLRRKPTPNEFTVRLIDILKEKYASGIITADEFIERKSIIEDIKYSNSYIPMLLERYANCKIGTKEFFNIKNLIEENKIDNDTTEQLVKGNLSYDEFRTSNKY
ncbi:SHOCT domain-containing protein [Clostridium cibarium]|uniref:SHOCT domain-containing protein n=1 Tax=Clostridium cibarium TaxID=2762247 RepID=A0ABR8PTX3_9CLOT|nr:SHOCT domain-containing protein [Clostridium cibarium]MBD7911574.1 SHOCT domain-containing protein [Clostridium cibarium]